MKKLFLILLLLSSCGGINLNEEFSTATGEYSHVEVPLYVYCVQGNKCEGARLAVDFWNQAIGFELFVFAPSEVNSVEVYFTDKLNSDGMAYATQSSDGTINCEIEALPSSPPNIIMHELGHCVGLYHSTNPRNIMHKKVPGKPIFSEDLIQLIQEITE